MLCQELVLDGAGLKWPAEPHPDCGGRGPLIPVVWPRRGRRLVRRGHPEDWRCIVLQFHPPLAQVVRADAPRRGPCMIVAIRGSEQVQRGLVILVRAGHTQIFETYVHGFLSLDEGCELGDLKEHETGSQGADAEDCNASLVKARTRSQTAVIMHCSFHRGRALPYRPLVVSKND